MGRGINGRGKRRKKLGEDQLKDEKRRWTRVGEEDGGRV